MPIPRRFDRRPPERDQTRVNERIRVPEVRLIGEDGNQVGVLSRDDALKYAQQRDLDLVEVAAEARPPVVRVLDYSKYKYEQEQKAKAARRHQKNVNVREIKLRPKIAENDYSTKKGHVERFLKGQDKVKVTIMFRGRETTHPERGERLLMRLAGEVGEIGTVEQRPTQDGRNMTMMLAPIKPRPESDADAPAGEAAAPAASAAPTPADGPAAVAGTPAAPAGGPAAAAGSTASPASPDGPAAAEPASAAEPAAGAPAEPASADDPGPAAPAPAAPAEPASADGPAGPAPRRGGTRAKAR